VAESSASTAVADHTPPRSRTTTEMSA
jgi:hypothetical protein